MKMDEVKEIEKAFVNGDRFWEKELIKCDNKRWKKFWAKAFNILVWVSVGTLVLGLVLFFFIVELHFGISYYESK